MLLLYKTQILIKVSEQRLWSLLLWTSIVEKLFMVLSKTESRNHKNSNGNLNLNFTGEKIKMMSKLELLMLLCGTVMNILEIEDVSSSHL
jgi:hypothetical protein